MTAIDRLQFRLAEAALCNCCKVNVPEVEAIIALLTPQVSGFWSQVADEAEQTIEREVRFGTPTDTIIAIVVSLVLEEVRFGLPARLSTIIEESASSLIAAGGRTLGFPPSTSAAARLLPAARGDLENLLRGRVESRLPELERTIASATGRRLRGSPVPLDRQAVTAEVRAFRSRLGTVLGAQTQRWVRTTVDLWAYRWLNLGAFAIGREQGVAAWRARATLDNRTTAFCQWVNGRIIAVEKLNRQFDAIVSSSLRGDVAAGRAAWPLLLEPDAGSTEDFSGFFGRTDVGFPPYHFNCRTRAVPVTL